MLSLSNRNRLTCKGFISFLRSRYLNLAFQGPESEYLNFKRSRFFLCLAQILQKIIFFLNHLCRDLFSWQQLPLRPPFLSMLLQVRTCFILPISNSKPNTMQEIAKPTRPMIKTPSRWSNCRMEGSPDDWRSYLKEYKYSVFTKKLNHLWTKPLVASFMSSLSMASFAGKCLLKKIATFNMVSSSRQIFCFLWFFVLLPPLSLAMLHLNLHAIFYFVNQTCSKLSAFKQNCKKINGRTTFNIFNSCYLL